MIIAFLYKIWNAIKIKKEYLSLQQTIITFDQCYFFPRVRTYKKYIWDKLKTKKNEIENLEFNL